MQLQADELRARLEPLFRENFEKFGELGAAVSVWQNSEPVIDLHDGFRDARREQPWTDDTIVLIWSATKALGSACLLHVLQEHKIGLESRVAEFWPKFAQAGKGQITLAQLLSHQAGLAALDRKVDILDYPAVIDALEKQEPNWRPGDGHGYHARTFGFLVDELVRRIMGGVSISEYWRKTFAEPLGLDIWIALPESENHRVATMYAAKIGKTPEPQQFYRDLGTPGTLARRAFSSPRGLDAVSDMNKRENREKSFVSFGGIASAHSLGKFYSVLANGGSEADGRLFFGERTMRWMATTLTDGMDRVFRIPTAFSAGFMKEANGSSRKIFAGSKTGFGHPGAGGSHAFADPENGISFAYVMNQMEHSVLPNQKSLRLVDAIYD